MLEKIKVLVKKYYYFLLIFFLVMAGAAIPEHFAVSTTASLKNRIFYLSHKDAVNVKTGDYIIFSILKSKAESELPAPLVKMLKAAEDKTELKRVGCSAGEFLNNIGNDYYCNKTYLGTAKNNALNGTVLDKYKFSGIVPQGSLFVVGDSKDSFDSRYFGFITVKNVEAVAYPII